jgi:hypothetical protein
MPQHTRPKFAGSPHSRVEWVSDVVVAAGGLATGLATIVVMLLLQPLLDLDLSSLMLWGFVPVGGLLCGFAAASGYYFVTLLTHRPPTRRLIVYMTVTGLATYGLTQYANYVMARTAEGARVADVIPFLTYYRVAAEHTSLQFRVHGVPVGHGTAELGRLGYLYESLRVLGFGVGAGAVWLPLKQRPYCPECRRYYRKQKLVHRASLDAVDKFLRSAGLQFPGLPEAYRTATARIRPVVHSVELYDCTMCERKEFRFFFQSGTRIVEVARYPYNGPWQRGVEL